MRRTGYIGGGFRAVALAAALLVPAAVLAQVTANPARDQPTRAYSPALGADAANRPNGQVEPPSKIRSGVQVMSPDTREAPRESGSRTTTVPSLNQLSGDAAKGVPGR